MSHSLLRALNNRWSISACCIVAFLPSGVQKQQVVNLFSKYRNMELVLGWKKSISRISNLNISTLTGTLVNVIMRTLPLKPLLLFQFCSGAQPVMRVFKTILYKQEVMYAVLVHSPVSNELLSDRPLLTDDPNSVCSYRDGCFIWRPEAMCETHRWEWEDRIRNTCRGREDNKLNPCIKVKYVIII